jgi:hypothetical protein
MVEKVDDDQLTSIIANSIRDSLGYEGDELSANFRDNLARYEGAPYGDERDGRSSVMSRDVLEAVEMVMPSLVRCFMGTESAAIFEPVGPEDEEAAEQATDYVNHVLMKQNPGFRIASSWMKSALITGSSFCKLWWDETEKVKEEQYSGLSEQEYMVLVSQDDVEVLEHTEFGEIDATEERVSAEDAMKTALEGIENVNVSATHDVRIRHTQTKGKLRWEAIPPEEFFINKRARSLDEEDNTWSFACHRQARTVEELISEGYDPDIIETASTFNDEVYDELTQQRFSDVSTVTDQYADLDPTQRRVFVYECYLKVDYDGDGRAELRRVTCVGGASNTQILSNEIAEELPFAEITAIPRPHRVYGYSLADLTKDLQRLKTALWRSMMDGLYLSLYPHKAVDENRVELDDLLSEDPGSIYRVTGDPRTAIVPLNTQWSGAQAFPMLQWIDAMLQKRTGINDMAGGLDASKVTTETARGVDEMANAARARVELICRQFAETGWTRLMRLAIQMLNRHQNKEEVVRLRGSWAKIDPSTWNVDMDLTINVGLGMGTKQEQISKLSVVAQKQEALMQQLGIDNPIAPINQYYNTLKKICEAADLNPGLFFTDPTQAMMAQKGQPKQPNPKQMEAQQKMELAKMQAQAKLQQSQAEAQMRGETDRMKASSDAEVARFKAELAAKTQREAAELKAAVDRDGAANRLAFEYEKMQRDHEYRMRELEAEKELEREKMAAGSSDGNGNINLYD